MYLGGGEAGGHTAKKPSVVWEKRNGTYGRKRKRENTHVIASTDAQGVIRPVMIRKESRNDQNLYDLCQ